MSWYFPLSALINAFTSTWLGIFLVARNYRSKTHRLFFYFCLSVAAWSYSYFLWQLATTASAALFWARSLMFGAIFTSLFYLHLVIAFLGLEREKFYRLVLTIFYFFSLLWTAANFTPYFVAGVAPRLFFRFWPIPGPFYLPFLVGFIFHVFYASSLLWRAFKKSSGLERQQIGFLLLGLFLAFFGGSTNYFLWYNIPIPPYGNILVSGYVLLTAYSIVKYRFLNIKIVAAEFFTSLMVLIFFVEVFLSRTPGELAFRILAILLMTFFAVMLVRAVYGEVKQREEVEKLARALQAANARLQELDAAKSEFLGIAAHQLRTPLSIIKGYISMILDGDYGRVARAAIQPLQNVYSSNEHLIHLVDDFLDVTRIEAARSRLVLEPTDLKKLAVEVIQELSDRALAKKLTIKTELSAVPVIPLDTEKIRHVIFNFLDNAINYTEHGEILVSLAVTADRRQIIFTVQDSGVGFDAADQKNLFQKFYRGRNIKGKNVDGTGLGLFVCRKFIEAHQGEIWAASPGPERGSTFGFRLKLTPLEVRPS